MLSFLRFTALTRQLCSIRRLFGNICCCMFNVVPCLMSIPFCVVRQCLGPGLMKTMGLIVCIVSQKYNYCFSNELSAANFLCLENV